MDNVNALTDRGLVGSGAYRYAGSHLHMWSGPDARMDVAKRENLLRRIAISI